MRVSRKHDRLPRDPMDDRPTLGAKVLMGQIRDLPFLRGLVGVRIAYKRNDRGEHVVAVIWPPQAL